MLPQEAHVAHIRKQLEVEHKALAIISKSKPMTERELINKLSNLGFNKSEAQKAIIYLINGYEIKRNGELLELMTWND